MSEKLLNGANVFSGFKQMRCKAMAESVASNLFSDSASANCIRNLFLNRTFVNVMSTQLSQIALCHVFTCGMTFQGQAGM